MPHSARLVVGLQRYRHRLPERRLLQAHRVDVAASLQLTFSEPLAYFIHTQDTGLTGNTSDSMWRRAAPLHRRLERAVISRASSVVVFNPAYAETVQAWNPRARSFPTWFDASLAPALTQERDPYAILWVGRLEVPKDPLLALEAFARLVAADPSAPWRLTFLGSGTLSQRLHQAKAELPEHVADRVALVGRVGPDQVALAMARSGVFLMTSHAGYEGYPRVLVEAMAAGATPVVTEGCDTGGLIYPARNGFVTGRSPELLAMALMGSLHIDRDLTRAAASALEASVLVPKVLQA